MNLIVPFSVQAPIIFEGAEPDPTKYTKLELAYQILDKYLENRAWAAGDHVTIADFTLVATVSTIEVSITNIIMLLAHRTICSELSFHTQR
jgi:glutathione S-transferase